MYIGDTKSNFQKFNTSLHFEGDYLFKICKNVKM